MKINKHQLDTSHHHLVCTENYVFKMDFPQTYKKKMHDAVLLI
jgi:hypothetical protein